jgi:hypothetical protein
MKKNLFFLAIAASFMVMATSCKKDDPKPSIIGFWKGKYGNGNDIPTFDYAVLFKSGNKIRVYAGNNADTTLATKFDGTYNDDTKGVITTLYDEDLLTSAIVDGNYTVMQGTIGFSPSVSNLGTFNLTKQ